MSMVNSQGEWVVEPGEFRLTVGGSQIGTLSAGFRVSS
jgi:hypothetical protein